MSQSFPDTSAADDRADQRREKAEDQHSAMVDIAEGRIAADIKIAAKAGLDGQRAICLPLPSSRAVSGKEFRPIRLAMLDMLEKDALSDQLMNAFEMSQCPLIADLKVKIGDAWAADHARDLAELECEEQ